jgi:hypothetical protein
LKLAGLEKPVHRNDNEQPMEDKTRRQESKGKIEKL